MREKYRFSRWWIHLFWPASGLRVNELALAWGLPVKAWSKDALQTILRRRNIAECEPRLSNSARHTWHILDYSVEGKHEEEDFGATKTEYQNNRARQSRRQNPFRRLQDFGHRAARNLGKGQHGRRINRKGKMKWDGFAPASKIFAIRHSLNQPVFIDAENPGYKTRWTLWRREMMENTIGKNPIIYNTIQLTGTTGWILKEIHEKLKFEIHLAVKLVRGAYMEKERERAEEMDYRRRFSRQSGRPTRLRRAIDYCLETSKKCVLSPETQTKKRANAAQRIRKRRFARSSARLFFTALQGMSEIFPTFGEK